LRGQPIKEEKKRVEISEAELIGLIKQNKTQGRKFIGNPAVGGGELGRRSQPESAVRPS